MRRLIFLAGKVIRCEILVRGQLDEADNIPIVNWRTVSVNVDAQRHAPNIFMREIGQRQHRKARIRLRAEVEVEVLEPLEIAHRRSHVIDIQRIAVRNGSYCAGRKPTAVDMSLHSRTAQRDNVVLCRLAPAAVDIAADHAAVICNAADGNAPEIDNALFHVTADRIAAVDIADDRTIQHLNAVG